jgi:hypothetical protein
MMFHFHLKILYPFNYKKALLVTKGVKNAGFPPIRKQIGFFETSSRGIRTLAESQHFSHPRPLAFIATDDPKTLLR